MKKIVSLLTGFFILNVPFAQETLQTVTERGNSTDRQIAVVRSDGGHRFNATNGVDADLLIGVTAPENALKYAWMQSSVGGVHLVLNADNGGKVGIGTNAPDQKLTVKGGGIGFDHNSSDKKLYSPVDGVLEWMTHDGAGQHAFAISHQGDQRVYLNSNGNTYFNSGNVGIGTTSPGFKLEVNGHARMTDGMSVIGNSTTINSRPLDALSYSSGHYSAQVNMADFANGARPGYGFHAAGYYGAFLYQNAHNDYRIKEATGDDYNLWTSGNFHPANYFPLTGGDIVGDVTIGSVSDQRNLAVNGNIKTKKIKVTLTDWPDYVFEKSYPLFPLPELVHYIQQNKHLPGIPSVDEVKENGLDVGDNQAALLKKIEELTLYIIEQDNQLQKQKVQIEKQDKTNKTLEERLDTMERKLSGLSK